TSNVTLEEAYIRLHAPLVPGEYVTITICDTGIGMDPATQSQIFEPFFTTKGTTGTGLGLSMVYGIVKQSGGHIWVDSELDKGTTFKIYLPRVVSPGQTQALPAANPNDEQAGKPATESILLVEDETNLRYLASQYLTRQGYKVIEAADS